MSRPAADLRLIAIRGTIPLVYVLEGTYKIKLDNGPETLLTKGQTFYEALVSSTCHPCPVTTFKRLRLAREL